MDVREKLSNEKRLIDANRAMEIVRNQGIAHPNAYHLTNYATLILREAPTVDAVEVVRCRECKYSRINHLMKKDILSCENIDVCGEEYLFERNPNDFCSYGERKEGADNG